MSVKKISCVLTKAIRGKGNIGDLVSVKRGYARYLERFNKAIRATADVLKNIDERKKEWVDIESANMKNAEVVLSKLSKFKKITLVKRVSHADTLYSSVRAEDIIEFFKTQNIHLTKENLKIDHVIKTLGEHSVLINVYGNLDHELTVEVVKEG